MIAPTWKAVLDDWESFLDGLESALASGDWEPYVDQPAWQPPAQIDGGLAEGDQGRALALADRAGRLRERLQSALRTAALDVGGERRRADGMSAYHAAQRRG